MKIEHVLLFLILDNAGASSPVRPATASELVTKSKLIERSVVVNELKFDDGTEATSLSDYFHSKDLNLLTCFSGNAAGVSKTDVTITSNFWVDADGDGKVKNAEVDVFPRQPTAQLHACLRKQLEAAHLPPPKSGIKLTGSIVAKAKIPIGK